MENNKLCEIKTNIVNWYNFKKNLSILQINASEVEISKYLNDVSNSKLTIAYQNDEEKNKIKNEVKCNTILIDNLENREEFDYVCLIGTLNVYKKDEKAYKKLNELMKIAKENCKPDGTIILVLDNKYGMKFWTSIYANKNILCNDKFALSKTMIEEILDKHDLKTRKFYYALPDYSLTNVIFSDEYLPTLDTISRNFTCSEDEFMSFNQTESYQEILKEDVNLFPFFANSYFVEIKKQGNIETTAKFISYTNIRKDKYRIKTIISDTKVEKTNASNASIGHIQTIKNNIDIMNNAQIKTLDSYVKDKIESKFVKEKSYDQVLIEYLQNGEEDKFYNEINKYKNYLYEKLEATDDKNTVFEKYNIEVEEEQKEKMHFVKNGLWDLIFQNAFYIDNDLYFYDQEWYEENIPVEFIIYRAIIYFGELHRYISKDILLEKLKIKEFEQIFNKLDNCFQEEIRDEEMWSLHTKIKTGQTLYDLYNNLINEFNEYKNNNVKNQEIRAEFESQKQEIDKQNEKILALEAYNKKIIESTSWKITKPIRALGKYLKK